MSEREQPPEEAAERDEGQRPLVHETPASPGNYDSNEAADDAVEVLEPDGTPSERDDS